MTVSLDEALSRLSPERRARIEARAAARIAEELTLRELRKAQNLTQKALAKRLGVKQESISNLEARTDMLMSTLRKYVNAMGGKLDLIVSFPGRAPVSLESLAQELPDRPQNAVKRTAAKQRRKTVPKSARGLRSAELSR
jgi:transcriptional regulator with XRE-family HTH domain